MNTNTRRFAATLALTLVLASSPAAFAASRRADDREITPIVKFLKRVFSVITFDMMPTGPRP